MSWWGFQRSHAKLCSQQFVMIPDYLLVNARRAIDDQTAEKLFNGKHLQIMQRRVENIFIKTINIYVSCVYNISFDISPRRTRINNRKVLLI